MDPVQAPVDMPGRFRPLPGTGYLECSERPVSAALKEQVTDEDGEYLHTVDVSKLMEKTANPMI
ncbi:MAG: hypothetical protein ACLTLQ_06375 [[Clostridium] scindens]